MSSWIPTGLAVVAAVFFSLSSALKHRSARHPPGANRTHGISALVRMTRDMLRHPAWLAGLLADVGGLTSQVIALHLGGLLLVQPVLVSAVAGTLVVAARLDGRRPTAREVSWSSVLVLSLAAFVVPLELGGSVRTAAADRAPGYVLAALGAVLVAGAVAAARWRGHGRAAASALGAATGILYAAAAALITVVGVQLTQGGLTDVLRHDEVYVLALVGVGSQVLNQASFAAARISASVPVTTSVDLVASVVLGVAVFDEPLPHSPLALAIAVLGLGGAAVTAFVLAATPEVGGAVGTGCP